MTKSGDPRLLYGKNVRQKIMAAIRRTTSRLPDQRKLWRLLSVGIGNIDEISVYIRGQARAAAEVGLPFDEQRWPASLTQEDCKKRLVQMNNVPDVIGVILQRPVLDHINVHSLQSAIHPLKDVEGMSPASIGNIVYNDTAPDPCSAAASIEMIKATGLDLKGLEVVMVGHSEIVGKPDAFMLMAEGYHRNRMPPHDTVRCCACAPRRCGSGGCRSARPGHRRHGQAGGSSHRYWH